MKRQISICILFLLMFFSGCRVINGVMGLGCWWSMFESFGANGTARGGIRVVEVSKPLYLQAFLPFDAGPMGQHGWKSPRFRGFSGIAMKNGGVYRSSAYSRTQVATRIFEHYELAPMRSGMVVNSNI